MAAAFPEEEASASSTAGKIPWHEKLEKAKSYKQDGNNKYKTGAHKAAVGKYHRALLYLKGIDASQEPLPFYNNEPGTQVQVEKIPEPALEEVEKLKIDCYNNLAACLLQLEEPPYPKIQHYCDCVLELMPSNVKAMYRKGVSMYHQNQAEDALAVLKRASSLPDGQKDANIKKYMQLSENKCRQQDKKIKHTYEAMFKSTDKEEGKTDT